MGWKTDTVLIRPANIDEGAVALVRGLGFARLMPVSEIRYEQAAIEFAFPPPLPSRGARLEKLVEGALIVARSNRSPDLDRRDAGFAA